MAQCDDEERDMQVVMEFEEEEEEDMRPAMGIAMKDLPESKSRKWKCGDYTEVFDPSGNAPSVPRQWRICGNWLECPSTCQTSDGAQWQFTGNCADEP